MSHSSVDKLSPASRGMLLHIHLRGPIYPNGWDHPIAFELAYTRLATFRNGLMEQTPAGRERAAAILSERREVSGWFCRC